jgi:hypothetical protein
MNLRRHLFPDNTGVVREETSVVLVFALGIEQQFRFLRGECFSLCFCYVDVKGLRVASQPKLATATLMEWI